MSLEKYIPYSIRNNIKDPDLAGLLDYLEREIGWEISFQDCEKWWAISWESNLVYVSARLDKNPKVFLRTECSWKWKELIWRPIFDVADEMDLRLFLRNYKSILPAIRDLYRK